MTIYSKFLGVVLLFSVAGCSSSKDLTETPVPIAEPQAEEFILTASENWHLNSPNRDPYYGTGVSKAYQEFLDGKSPAKEVIVAIIDSGTDVDHEDLKGNIWVNKNEIAGNGIDDDGNGYIDDINGWNFIGGPDSTSVNEDTYEVTRLYVKLSEKFIDADTSSFSSTQKEEYYKFLDIKKDYEAKKVENQQSLNQLKNIYQAILGAKQILGVSSMDSVSTEQMVPNANDGPYLQQAKQLAQLLKENNISETDISEAVDQLQTLKDFGLNAEFDPRYIVGDDYENLTNRYYGNNDVKGASYSHGTHVAGIVGAVRNNEIGINGIANVKLMILRAVPMGDERDKDIANAVRYAAENGADIINMSFGKPYSPYKEYVDAAFKYADSIGVLMISGAGNDATNIDSTNSFPSKYYKSGGYIQNYITVGASSWKPDEELTAAFSNYGKMNVDIFAPGVDVYSTYPNNKYKSEDGTSMASPVVAGVAALVMSYYPELTAIQVKELLMDASTKPSGKMVYKPGSEQLIPFSTLSVSGGIVNAYETIKLAEQLVKGN